MNFTSLQKLAVNFKQLSSLDETFITGASSNTSLSAENLNKLTNLTFQTIIFCKEKKFLPTKPAEHTIENGKQTKAHLYQLFLTKFKKDLLQYEHKETVTKFEVNAPEHLSLSGKLINSFKVGEIAAYLTTVNNLEGKLNCFYLLTMSDRGCIWGQ